MRLLCVKCLLLWLKERGRVNSVEPRLMQSAILGLDGPKLYPWLEMEMTYLQKLIFLISIKTIPPFLWFGFELFLSMGQVWFGFMGSLFNNLIAYLLGPCRLGLHWVVCMSTCWPKYTSVTFILGLDNPNC